MHLHYKAEGFPERLAILSAAFHPPTLAHLALAEAALASQADEVLLVLPRRFPHKEYGPVGLDERLGLLQRLAERRARLSVGVSEGGLFREIAAEAMALYGPTVRLRFLCGRDAAERIVNWTYGEGDSIGAQLRLYDLLVAPRAGAYVPPPDLAHAIEALPLRGDWDEVSSTHVREAIAQGQPWRHLVPEEIVDEVARLYR
jgi:nicotinate-nucleotide adenylyltransferase